MSFHLDAKKGQYAPIVLMPGDPQRAQLIAEKVLTDSEIVNRKRNCMGYTGYYGGVRVSVQASGMGQPSASIYATELYKDYDVDTIIRIGTCGALDDRLSIGDVVVALTSATDTKLTNTGNFIINPHCDIGLYQDIMPRLQKQYTNVMSGQITSNSIFYQDDLDWYKQLVRYGVLAVDMETYQLYLIANKFRKKALTVNLVSDLVYDLSHFPISDEDKETAFIMLVTNILDSIYVKHFS